MTNNLQKFIILSLGIHAVLIIALSIKWYTNITQSTKSIEVVLTKEQSPANEISLDFLAQKENEGGGESDKKNIPKSESAIFPDELYKKITPAIDNELLNNKSTVDVSKNDNHINTTLKSQQKTVSNKNVSSDKQNLVQETTNFAFNIENQPEVASLMHDIEERAALFAKRSKKRFISASTQEYRDAEYLDAWRKKIEYYGNKYYPVQAKARNLSGSVIVLVAINANGQLQNVRIEKSSGIKILDEAAIQAVHLAAPFNRFTNEMRKDTDVLEIVRTWRFNEEGISNNLAVAVN